MYDIKIIEKGGGQMIVEYKKKANLWLIIGFIVWLVGNILKGITEEQGIQFYAGYFLFILGFGLFIYGCINYVKAKGYHWAVGLLGTLNLIGLIILAILPDKQKVIKSK